MGIETNNANMKLSDAFLQERDRIMREEKYGAQKNINLETTKLTIDEYRDALLDFYEDLQRLPAPNVENNKIEISYPTGNKCLIIAIPFFPGGMSFRDKADIENNLVRSLIIGKDRKTYGFGDRPGYYSLLLPDEIMKDVEEGGCVFDIEYPYPDAINSEENKKYLQEKINHAFLNLRRLLG